MALFYFFFARTPWFFSFSLTLMSDSTASISTGLDVDEEVSELAPSANVSRVSSVSRKRSLSHASKNGGADQDDLIDMNEYAFSKTLDEIELDRALTLVIIGFPWNLPSMGKSRVSAHGFRSWTQSTHLPRNSTRNSQIEQRFLLSSC